MDLPARVEGPIRLLLGHGAANVVAGVAALPACGHARSGLHVRAAAIRQLIKVIANAGPTGGTRENWRKLAPCVSEQRRKLPAPAIRVIARRIRAA